MIKFNDALKLIDNNVKLLPKIEVPLLESLGYVLAEPIRTNLPIPFFNSSAVDGFAVKIKDVNSASKKHPIKLKIQGSIQAGDTNNYKLKKHHTFKIFTGALVPSNVDAIVMKEDVVEDNGYITINIAPKKWENIRKKGEEFKKGNIVLKSDQIITPPIIGLLASLGIRKVTVRKKPTVSVIVTGNELRSYDQNVLPGQIRDSNAPSLIAALSSINCQPILLEKVEDNLIQIKRAIKKAMKRSDIIITTGGVSVGDYDFIREAAQQLGFKEIYYKVAIKPGKPNFFAVHKKVLLFGLPGNPVAVLVSFEKFVKYAIRKMMRLSYTDQLIKSKLATNLRKNSNRLEFVRGICKISQEKGPIVFPIEKRDSHMLGGIAQANCLIYFPENKKFLPKNSIVNVLLLDWFKI